MDKKAHAYLWENPKTHEAIKQGDYNTKLLIDSLQSDSLLLVFGDHGSKSDGSHSGASKEELEAGLFTYSKKNFTFREFKYPQNLPLRIQELIKILGPALDIDFLNREGFKQIDTVPTMSAIFNLPIPHNNLGVLIPEMLHYNCNVVDCLYNLFMEYIINIAQVTNYVDAYEAKLKRMGHQKAALNEIVEELKKELPKIMVDSNKIFEAEKEYIKGRPMSEETKNEYITFVKDLFRLMKPIRATLTVNAYEFEIERHLINMNSIYCSYVIRMLITISIILSLILITISTKQEVTELFTHSITKGYPHLMLILLLIVTLVNIEQIVSFFPIVCGVLLWCIITLGKLCWMYRDKIRELVLEEKYWLSTVLSIVVMIGTYIYLMLEVKHYDGIVRTFLYALLIINLLIYFNARMRNIPLLMILIVLIVFFASYQACYLSRCKFLIINYFICSVIPTILFSYLGLYLILKRVSREINVIVKMTFISFLILSTTGMLYYQIGELDDSFKSSYFTHILLPRLVFALSCFQMLYLIFSLFFKQLLWRNLPSKKERIFAFFTLLLTSTMPSLLMLAGPYHQIYFFLMTLICYSLNYVLSKIGLKHSYYFYTTYVFIAFLFYFITDHQLNYLLLRFDRIYVGFPHFRVITNFFTAFFETFGAFSYMMALLPLITVMSESEDGTKKRGNVYFPSKVILESHPLKKEVTEEDKEELKKYNALEITLVRNYLMVLLNFELIHNGFTAHLLIDFVKAFSASFPLEGACRILNWYIYLLTLIFGFAIAKI